MKNSEVIFFRASKSGNSKGRRMPAYLGLDIWLAPAAENKLPIGYFVQYVR